MKDYIELRAIEVGRYIIDSKATVRKTATKFGVSKSTVHKDLTERLPQIDHHLAEEVRDILDINKSERDIRGGMDTRQKYMLLHRVNYQTFIIRIHFLIEKLLFIFALFLPKFLNSSQTYASGSMHNFGQCQLK